MCGKDSDSFIMKELTFEETPPGYVPAKTIGGALLSVVQDPAQLIRHWNYKGAILSGSLRAPIFLITYLVGKESIKLALGAAFIQFAFRFLFAGFSGAVIQAFRRVEPAWKALMAIIFIVPVVSHIFEYFVQTGFAYYTSSNDHTGQAIIRSICVSVISALFSLFIMRRNVLIVGESESKSLLSDMGRMPLLIFDFVAFIPLEIAQMLRRKEFISAVFSFIGFGVFSQMLCWAVTNKPFWTFSGGKSIFLLKFWGVDGMILMLFALVLALIFLSTKSKEK